MTKFGFDWEKEGSEEMWFWRVPGRIICNVNVAVAIQVSLAVSFLYRTIGIWCRVDGWGEQVKDRVHVVQALKAECIGCQ